MQNEFDERLRGSVDEAIATQKQISKYYERCGSSGHQDAAKHQLIYAMKTMHSIAKCDLKHAKIYCDIITQTFGDTLKPEKGVKYWDAYVDSIRFFHYGLVAKKEYKMASEIYHHISLYHDKLENENVCLKLVDIYSYHLFLQASLLQRDKETAFHDASHALENLAYLFQVMLQKNRDLNFQYKDVLKKSLQCLFPSSGLLKINQFFNALPAAKLSAMFDSLFELSTTQLMPLLPKEEREQYATYVMEKLYNFLNFDMNDKSQLNLSVQLLRHCRVDSQLTTEEPLSELWPLLYEYSKLIFSRNRIFNFEAHFSKLCERFKYFFDTQSKSLSGQQWFKDFLVVFSYLHTQLQSTLVFTCFWGQMSTTLCFKSLLGLLMDAMKLSPCITADSKLNWSNCCSSFRKHVIISFALAALSSFVLYCQNMKEGPKELDEESSTDIHYEDLHKNLILILNHAFKIVEKMDCINSTSQEITTLVLRFKQASVSAKTTKQARTCIALCELLLKIKSKIADREWPLILRRVYKLVEQCMADKFQLKRDLQMCYIASMLQLPSEIDFTQIRAQISIYYSQNGTCAEAEANASVPPHDKCLLYMYQKSTNALKPYLEPVRKKLLHWLEMQTVVKYYKQNARLMESLLQCSQTQYDYAIIARTEKLQTAEVLTRLKAIKVSLKLKTGLSRLEQLTYGHVCFIILQDQQNVLIQSASKMESKEFSEAQLEQLLARKEMETMTISNELNRVESALEAFKAFEEFYEKFDNECISSNEVLIDWEAIIDDLGALAQYLHLGGYVEYSSKVWVLHYKISVLIQHDFSAFRSLAFMCEYSECCGENSPIDLNEEIQKHLPVITGSLDNLSSLQTRKQNYVFLAIIQIAYYYARCSKYTYAAMLIKYVRQKHAELHGSKSRYDVVLGSLDIVGYRLIWKNIAFDCKSKQELYTIVDDLYLNENLMLKIEEILDRFRFFVYATSSDLLAYVVLICNLLQDVAECAANRLYENISSSLFVAVCKCALGHGLALRMVQIMRMWMWINLQMEFVDEAHTKLKIMEYIMGVTSLKDPSENDQPVSDMVSIKSRAHINETYSDVAALWHNTEIEAMRRLAQVQLSPIKTTKLGLNTSIRNTDLNRHFEYKLQTNPLPSNGLFEWMYITIGCLRARLYFLIEYFDQLEVFYEKYMLWFQTRPNNCDKRYFKNFHFVTMQHYVNFLRASGKMERAEQCLKYALELCDSTEIGIDVVYCVNFRLQLLSTHINNTLKAKTGNSKKRLTYNYLPEEDKEKHNEAKGALKSNMLQHAMATCKKKSVDTITKAKTVTSSSGSSSPETKRKLKTKLKFNICEDPIEICDSDDDIDIIKSKNFRKKGEKSATTSENVGNLEISESEIANKMENLNLIGSKKKTGTENRCRKTPSVPKSIATANLLDDSPKQKAATKSATNHLIEQQENQNENKIKNKEFPEGKKKSAAGSRSRSRHMCKKSTVPNPSAPIIILNDSPIMRSVENNMTRSRGCLKNNKESGFIKRTTKNVQGTDIPTSSRRLRSVSPRQIL